MRQLLMIDHVRFLVALGRYTYYAILLRRLRTFEGYDEAVASETIQHNLKRFRKLAVVRSLQIIRPLSVVEKLSSRIGEARVLAVGPRTEGELLSLVAHGFRPRNVRGLDLISYSPWVDLGDMHSMPYEDDTWDAIVMGWVIAYSNDRAKVAKEVVRIAKRGCVVGIGVEHNPLTNAQIAEKRGYLPGAERRIGSVAEILGLFGDHVDQVYVSHDVDPSRLKEISAIYTVFSIRK